MTVSIKPLSDALGVEVTGVDLSRPVDPDDLAAMKRAHADHLVMVVRGQKLTPEQYLTAARLFGDTMPQHLSDMLMDEHPEIAVLDSRKTIAGPDGIKAATGSRAWHTDHTNHARPPKTTVLYALSLPSSGGDTGFANMQEAYAALPEPERKALAALKTVNKIEDHDYVSAEDRKKFGAPQIHPLVRTHPDTGRKALYFHPGKTDRVGDMAPDESQDFLNDILEKTIKPDVTYRHKWQVGDVLLCDNRAVLHLAYDDYDHAEGRVMHRIILEGEVPF
ncbi:MAG: TauD/TfdA family dioxygenase [Alphaproteobacteria bacterium]|nr:TauD/TfdA family dioxygenase [Alphaproteobacteria bacterium]